MKVSTRNTIRWDQTADGIVCLTLDDPEQSANTMNGAYKASMRAVLDRLHAERELIGGVVVTSAKPTFFAGGDLRELQAVGPEDAAGFKRHIRELKSQLRELETLGFPVVAAINGTALGGGLEIALACHHRIALDRRGLHLGLPEVTLGLLPGGGGIVRTVRLLGVLPALNEVLLRGQPLSPAQALELGLVDELAGSPEDLLAAAHRWIATHPVICQPFDREAYQLPGGVPQESVLSALSPGLRREVEAGNNPAPARILAAAVESASCDIDAAHEVELEYFVELVTGHVAKNMIQGLFFDLQSVRGRRRRLAEFATHMPSKVVVVGDGPVAADVARVCTDAGLEVLCRAAAAVQIADLDGADAVIDAGCESVPVASTNWDEIATLRFARSPEKTTLTEVVVRERTSEATLARALDVARCLERTPVVVTDSGGFVARVAASLVGEAMTMVGEGVSPETIEAVSTLAGFDPPPLMLGDELGLICVRRLAAAGARHAQPGSAAEVVRQAMMSAGRFGAADGKGFYDYSREGEPIHVWAGLADLESHHGPAPDASFDALRDRLLRAPANEASRCVAEGVVQTVADGNVASLLGLGYPNWTGGALQFLSGDPDATSHRRTRA